MSAIEFTAGLSILLDKWSTERPTGDALVSLLTRLAELVEVAAEAFYKQDPDPFDDRHPSRVYPDCLLGHVLKKIIRNEDFMEMLFSEYTTDTFPSDVNVVAVRLLLDLLPGMNAESFRDPDGLVSFLILWAERAVNPLQAYATGVLAVAMADEDVVFNYKEQTRCLVPVMLERLRDLSLEYFKISPKKSTDSDRPFAHLNKQSENVPDVKSLNSATCSSSEISVVPTSSSPPVTFSSCQKDTVYVNELSSGSWSEMEYLMIGKYQVYPLTLADEQRYILQYLASIGDYQEFLTPILEDPQRTLKLLLQYVDLNKNSNVRLAFDALKYLGMLLCHKKCALDFISEVGVHHILKVHRPSLAATGVSFVLYYLAYNKDAVHKICSLQKHVVSDIVSYALWLLECSHSSGRAHATMFFGLTLDFAIIRQLFAMQDGLRKLLNAVSTLDIVVQNPIRPPPAIGTIDEWLSNRQICRHVCVTLKRLFAAYAESKAFFLRHGRSEIAKVHYRQTSLEENVRTIVNLMPSSDSWQAIEELLKLDGITLLLKLIVMNFDWTYSGKIETVRSALDVLYISSVCDKVKLAMCESVHYLNADMEPQKKVGLSILLQAAVGDVFGDVEVRCSALNIIINCVCRSNDRKNEAFDVFEKPYVKPKINRANEDMMSRIWNCVRSSNGIMVLCRLLTIKLPLTDADAIRALACQALCGLANCVTVMQIISKLPLITSGHLQVLMREPVLRGKKQEHSRFVKYCAQLIQMVAGRSVSSEIVNINKVEIAAQTEITYNKVQLLQLIMEHLKTSGYTLSAATLQKEAKLEPVKHIKLAHKNTVNTTENVGPCTGKSVFSNWLGVPCSSHCASDMQNSSELSAKSHTFESLCLAQTSEKSSIGTEKKERHFSAELLPPSHMYPASSNKNENLNAFPVKRKASSSDVSEAAECPPVKAMKSTHVESPTSQERTTVNGKTQRSSFSSCKKLRSSEELSSMCTPSPQDNFSISLDSIVSEYLRNQHSLCSNPYVTCPAFDLFKPHQCPEPHYVNKAPNNITVRSLYKQYCPSYWGRSGTSMMRKFLSTRFRDVSFFQDPDGNKLTSCAFAATKQHVLIGNSSGNLKVYEMYNGNEVHSYQCHETEVSNIQFRKSSSLFLTSASWMRPVSALWDSLQGYQLLYLFEDECYAEFSKLTQDKIIATKNERARVFDVQTGNLVVTLEQTNFGNAYTANRATFNFNDELVLSDGVLWDVRSQKVVHKLDKFNNCINGVFHPNGLEIVSNSEIWDLRTFRLLRTVPELAQVKVLFDDPGDVIYGAIILPETEDRDHPSFKRYGSFFRSFDSVDYSCIGTKDVQKGIYDIELDYTNRHLCVIQAPLQYNLFGSEFSCHIYEIGKSVEVDDDEDVEDEDDVEDEEDDDDAQELQQSDEDYNGENNDGPDDNLVGIIASGQSSGYSNSASDDEYYFSFQTS